MVKWVCSVKYFIQSVFDFELALSKEIFYTLNLKYFYLELQLKKNPPVIIFFLINGVLKTAR